VVQPHSRWFRRARWCARADAIFDVPDMHVLDERRRPVLTVESGQVKHGCPLWCACGWSRSAECGFGALEKRLSARPFSEGFGVIDLQPDCTAGDVLTTPAATTPPFRTCPPVGAGLAHSLEPPPRSKRGLELLTRSGCGM
jgi:hypothetical protein